MSAPLPICEKLLRKIPCALSRSDGKKFAKARDTCGPQTGAAFNAVSSIRTALGQVHP